MKTRVLFVLLSVLSMAAEADINERTHPAPAQQAKINRVIAQAWATGQPPTDHTAVFQGVQPQFGQGLSLGLNIGTVNASNFGLSPREVNIVTKDNIVVCLHCRGR